MAQVSRKKIIDNFLSNDDDVVRVLREVNFARFVENGEIQRGWEVVLRKVQENRPDKHDIKKCLRYWEKKQMPLQILKLVPIKEDTPIPSDVKIDEAAENQCEDAPIPSDARSDIVVEEGIDKEKSELQIMLTKSSATAQEGFKDVKSEELPTTSSSRTENEISMRISLNNHHPEEEEWQCIQIYTPSDYQVYKERSKENERISRDTRIFVANLTSEVNEEELEQLFSQYGKIRELFLNSELGFATIHMETRANAECAKLYLDGYEVGGKPLRVRLAMRRTTSKSADRTAVNVDNLSPLVSNELLEQAFSKFGQVERARVIVDDNGHSTMKGVVEFRKRKSAEKAVKKIQTGNFLITSSPRVVTATLVKQEDLNGLPDERLPKTALYYLERKLPPRFAGNDTFEELCARTWKVRYNVELEQRESFEKHLKESREKFEWEMECCHREHMAMNWKKEVKPENGGDELKHKCPQCPERFSSQIGLDAHTRIHNKETQITEIVHQDPLAVENSSSSPTRKRRRQSKNQYNFQCPECPNRRFKSQHILNKHMVIHQDRAFPCNQCNMRFHLSKDLKVHERIHSKDKPYSCSYCGKKFTQSGTLNRHMRIHTGEKPFQCGTCNERFTWKESLQQHLKKCEKAL